MKMLTLTMPNNALTISIITLVLDAPPRRNLMASRAVKRNHQPIIASQSDW
jgi:hypothetical protein